MSAAMAPVSDVTALFNTNAFWVYLLSGFMTESSSSRRRWDTQNLLAVLAACLGVLAVVYGGTQARPDSELEQTKGEQLDPPSFRPTITSSPTVTAVGYALALASSISFALYQVLYERYAIIYPGDDNHKQPSPPSLSTDCAQEPLLIPIRDIETRSTLPNTSSSIAPPFAFYPNFLTSLIGLTTLLFLWIPIPFMHILDLAQPFAFPADAQTWGYVGLIAVSGVVFNAGFMVLLGLWGPVVVSVGNLLTIVLVLAGDAMFGNGGETITVWGLVGCGMIVSAFGILALDVLF